MKTIEPHSHIVNIERKNNKKSYRKKTGVPMRLFGTFIQKTMCFYVTMW